MYMPVILRIPQNNLQTREVMYSYYCIQENNIFVALNRISNFKQFKNEGKFYSSILQDILYHRLLCTIIEAIIKISAFLFSLHISFKKLKLYLYLFRKT